MILNVLADAVIALGGVVIGLVNAAWSHVDTTVFGTAVYWYSRLNDWMPISDLALMLTIVASLATVSQVLKYGLKIIDWVRG